MTHRQADRQVRRIETTMVTALVVVVDRGGTAIRKRGRSGWKRAHSWMPEARS